MDMPLFVFLIHSCTNENPKCSFQPVGPIVHIDKPSPGSCDPNVEAPSNPCSGEPQAPSRYCPSIDS